jgi:hypothetical protein
MQSYLIPQVTGLPPKKNEAKSMWNDAKRIEHVIRLRQAARSIFETIKPLTSDLAVVVTLRIDHKCYNRGDLDNYIGGICDALMATRCSDAQLCKTWNRAELVDIHPRFAIAYQDDRQIKSLHVVIEQVDSDSWYSIELRPWPLVP